MLTLNLTEEEANALHDLLEKVTKKMPSPHNDNPAYQEFRIMQRIDQKVYSGIRHAGN